MPNDKGMEFHNPNYSPEEPNPEEKSAAFYYLSAVDKLQKQLSKAYKDELTNCYNRNFYENFKENNFDPNRDNDDLGLVFVDINNLKEVNDGPGGHEAGDDLIKNTANFLKSSFRKEDLVIRLGGDEFIVVCRNHENDPDFKNHLSPKITERLNNNPPTNFAFGIAVYDKELDSSSLDKTKDRADALMYKNKAQKKVSTT